MAEQLISASGVQYGAAVDETNRLLVRTEGISLGSSLTVTGSVVLDETAPVDSSKNNPAFKFEYDGNGNIGSIIQYIGAGSYTQIFTWNGTQLTNIGSYF